MPEKKQVLIICHTAAGQMYLGVLLNRIWYTPYLAKTPEEGIGLARNMTFSLVIFDGDMVTPDLHTAIQMLRIDPVLKDMPLVVFITDDHAGTTGKLLEQGCSAVLTKPLDLAIMYEVLARITGQRRTTPRIPVKMPVTIIKETTYKELMSVNMSEGGLYLRTAQPLPEGTNFHVKFTLPYDTEAIELSAETESIELSAEVVRSLSLGTKLVEEPGMGIRFLNVPEDVLQRIRNFVQWEITGDLEWKPDI